MVALLPFLSILGFGQSYLIQTFAGGALPVKIAATSASLYGPVRGVVDKAGNLIFTDGNSVLKRDKASGILSLIAGNGTQGFSGDGDLATNAQLSIPAGIAADSAGNLYVADYGNGRVRKISASGVITTVESGLNLPIGVAVDVVGNLFIADAWDHVVYKRSNGVLTIVAGTRVAGFSGDNGPATSATLNTPLGVALDSSGNLYIADGGNRRVRKVSNGVITTFAGNGDYEDSGDNFPAKGAGLKTPVDVAVDSSGRLYIADLGSARVRQVSDGVITTVAGIGTAGYSGDNGPATSAQLYGPRGIAVDTTGSLYIMDGLAGRIRKVSGGVITTVAGNGTLGFSGDRGLATNAQLRSPAGVAVDKEGSLYIADTGNSRVRKVSHGEITTFAGNGQAGYGGDNGLATSASLYQPTALAFGPDGSLYIADTGNHRVRKVSAGIITTVAGDGTPGFSGDAGLAASSQLSSPGGVAVDPADNLYISDTGNNRIRKVSRGVIATIAGFDTTSYGGDGGPALYAALNAPGGLAFDVDSGSLYIADTGNNRVRKIVSYGVITAVAGDGVAGYSGDGGPATGAHLNSPLAVAVDSAGALYIADRWNGRVRKISDNVITTIAGTGGRGYAGDNGPALSAELSYPNSVALDASGNVYFAESGNQRVRVLTPGGSPCSYSLAPAALTPPAIGGPFTVGVLASGSCGFWQIADLPDWITVQGSSFGSTDADVTLVVAANAGPARAAYPTIGGVVLAVTQSGGLPCEYSLDYGGRVFPAAGGAGSVTVNTSSGCSWTASTSLSWVSNVSPESSIGAGVVSFDVDANAGDPRSGTLTVAGFSFAVQQAGSASGLKVVGSMPQIASGGLWNTTITLMNNGSGAATARLNFFDDKGSPLQLPLVFPQAALSGPTLASSLDQTIAPGAAFIIKTAGNASGASATGWAQLLATGDITGFAVFAWDPGAGAQQAVVPLETRNPDALFLGFDNTGGTSVGVAIANMSAMSANVGVTVRNDHGVVLTSSPVALPPCGHAQFMVTDFASMTANIRGTLEFDTPEGGQIAVLGIQALSTGAITSVPAGSSADLNLIGSMAQIAAGGLWNTTITLTNNGADPAPVRLKFFDEHGAPLPLPLIFPQDASTAPVLTATLDRTILPGALLVVQTAGRADQAEVSGWAQLSATGNVSGGAVFAWNPGSGAQQAVVPLEARDPDAFVLFFDNTGGSAMGVALANMDTSTAIVRIVIRDDAGSTLASTSRSLEAQGHTEFMVTDLSSLTANKRGTLEFRKPTDGQIAVVGIEALSTGAITTVPATTK